MFWYFFVAESGCLQSKRPSAASFCCLVVLRGSWLCQAWAERHGVLCPPCPSLPLSEQIPPGLCPTYVILCGLWVSWMRPPKLGSESPVPSLPGDFPASSPLLSSFHCCLGIVWSWRLLSSPPSPVLQHLPSHCFLCQNILIRERIAVAPTPWDFSLCCHFRTKSYLWLF
jgi:hypothetical protein